MRSSASLCVSGSARLEAFASTAERVSNVIVVVVVVIVVIAAVTHASRHEDIMATSLLFCSPIVGCPSGHARECEPAAPPTRMTSSSRADDEDDGAGSRSRAWAR